MTDAQRLTRLLRDEIALQTQHCRLLEAQQRALADCDRPGFMGLQPEYAALVEQLKAQAEARGSLLCDAAGGETTVAALVEALPESQRPAPAALRDTLARTLARAQDLCRRNEALIHNELEYMAFTLDLFVEAGRRADINYGGGGRLGRRKLLDRRA